MTKKKKTKPAREELKSGEVLCDYCTAKCCRYFALPIDTPKKRRDYEFMRWYLLHDRASIFTEVPEADSIDIPVRVPKRLMVGVIVLLPLRGILEREVSRHADLMRAEDRIQHRFRPVGSEQELGKWRTSDQDGRTVGRRFDRDRSFLGTSRQHTGETNEGNQAGERVHSGRKLVARVKSNGVSG